jgi:bacterioferritin-associated ferredoxin
LPSQGQYWGENALDLPVNGEIGVMPMTALDEISYRTPDALFNGQAVVDVIQSCVPNIRDAWQTPSLDVNSLLISIRIASYGHEMEVTSTCPKCQESQDYGIDMRRMLENMGTPDYAQTMKLDDIEIFFRPLTFRQQTQVNLDQYETQRMLAQAQTDQMADEVRIQRMTEVMKKINQATTRALTFGIAGIRSPQGFVDSAEWIAEFLTQCGSKTYSTIRDHIIDLRNDSELKPVAMTCGSCQHAYEQIIEINMSNFFGIAS